MISNYFKTASGSIFFFDDFDVTSAANDLEALYTERLHIADVYAFKKAS